MKDFDKRVGGLKFSGWFPCHTIVWSVPPCLIAGLPLLSEQAAKEAAVLLLTRCQLFEPCLFGLHCLELFFQKRPDVRIQILSSYQLLYLLDTGLVLGP